MNRALTKIPLVTLLVALSVANAWAADRRTSLDDLTRLVEWFKNFTVIFDGIAAEEERSQFLRAVDRLKTSLYELEVESRLLVSAIPKQSPTAEQRKELQNRIRGLEELLEQVRRNIRKCGQGIREREGTYDLEGRIYSSVATRSAAISYTDALLHEIETQPQKWNPEEIVQRMNYAIDLVSRAHIAVTSFRERVAAAPTEP